MAVGSHHQPLSHARGCGPTPSGLHTLAVGSHHWPASHARGCGPTPSGRHTLAVGSHHWPASHGRASGASGGRHTFAFGSHHSPFAHCAELTAGVAIVTAAKGANAITTTGRSRRTNVPMGPPLVCSTLAEVQLRRGGHGGQHNSVRPSGTRMIASVWPLCDGLNTGSRIRRVPRQVCCIRYYAVAQHVSVLQGVDL